MGKGRTAKAHRVHGELLTIAQAAERLGVNESALRNQLSRMGGGLEACWDYYLLHPTRRGSGRAEEVHQVHGELLTTRQIARRLGRSPHALYAWRGRNPTATMEAAYDHFRALPPLTRRAPSTPPRRYWTPGGEFLTIAQAAERLGVPENTLRHYIWRNRTNLAAAWRYFDARRTERAVAEILAVLGF